MPLADTPTPKPARPPINQRSRRSRRWFQFSLRSLLVLILAVAILCALIVWQGFLGGLLFGAVAGVLLFGVAIRRSSTFFALAGIALFGLSALLPFHQVAVWCGRHQGKIAFEVRDQLNNQGVPNASVQVRSSSDKTFRPAVFADQNGQGDAPVMFFTSGSDDFFGRSRGGMALWDISLKVQARGYEDFTTTLDEMIGKSRWPLDGPPFPVVVVELKERKNASAAK